MQITNVTIPNGGTLTEPIDCQEYVPVAIAMPDEWDAADITFQAMHDGAKPTNLIYRVTTDATGGTWNIDVDGQNDDADWDATTGELTTLLEGLSNVAVGDVVVSGEAGDWIIEFRGLLAAGDGPAVTVDFTNLTGDTANTATVVQSGSGGPWLDVYDADSNEVAADAAASRHIVLNPDGLRSVRWLRLRSGTSGTPVAQTPARTIGVVLVTDVGS